MKKFLIITTYGKRIIECEDFYKAVEEAYDDHTGYEDVVAIILISD